MTSPCPLCGGDGLVVEEVEGQIRAKVCPCSEASRKDRLLAHSAIPQRYRHCTLEAFSPQKDVPSQKIALEHSKRFAEIFPGPQVGLLFSGPCGTGKTHLAVGILHLCLAKGIPGVFADLNDVYRRVWATYNRQGGGEGEVLDPLVNTPLLILDEVGCRNTPWAQETLNYLVTQRYNYERPTLLTTNYLETPSQGESALVDRIGVRTRSRLHEMCRQVELSGTDFRQQVKSGNIQPF